MNVQNKILQILNMFLRITFLRFGTLGKFTTAGILFVCLLLGLTGNTTMEPPELTTIEVTPENPTLHVDESMLFTAEGKDQYGDPYPFDATWEGDGTYGTITPHSTMPPSCTYIGTQAGDGYIICWESPGIPGQNIHGSTDITVLPGGGPILTTIEVEPEGITLVVGQSQLYTATGYDQGGQPMDPPIAPIWSATGGTITFFGFYAATEEGVHTITASVAGSDVTGETYVFVGTYTQQLTTIEVEPKNIILELHDTQQYTATGYDQYDQPMDPPITPVWSATGGEISTTGLYTASEGGTHTITAGADGGTVTGETTVTVNPPSPQLTRIEVQPQDITLNLNDTQQYTATGYDQFDQPMDPPITPVWSVTGGDISPTGLYTATEEGTHMVNASVDGNQVTGSAYIHVGPCMLPGDANADGTVDVLDVLTTVNNILGLNPSPFHSLCADCKSDGIVDILDALGIVNVALGIGECGP